MEILAFIIAALVAAATIIAGIPPAMQLGEIWKNRRQSRIRIKTRTYSSELPAADAKPLKILNFSHPILPETKQQIEEQIQCPVEAVIDIQTQFNDSKPYSLQTKKLVEKIGFTPGEWQQGRFLVNPPGFAYITALLLSELHGRMGYFPTILRMRPLKDEKTHGFELAEIINLQEMRNTARKKR